MTYQAPEGWRAPARGPQHATPFGSSRPVRIQAHRALRLFVAAGSWGAGLCLIIGSVALVAEAAGPDHPTHVTAAAGGYRLRSGQLPGHVKKAGPGSPAPPVDGARHVLRTFGGTGNQTTAQFRVAAHSRWELRWSYRCAARAPRGHLLIREAHAAGDGVSVDAAGAAGHGRTWTYSDAATHYLVVITNCAWTVKVGGHL